MYEVPGQTQISIEKAGPRTYISGSEKQILEKFWEFFEGDSRFKIVFLDPPFGQGWLPKILPLAADLCNSTGVLYAESEAPLCPSILASCRLELIRADRAGDVFYHLLRRNNNE